MDYIKIYEWDKFQHYKKRNPPWIKLYSKLLEDDDFDCLPDDSKLLFFCLLLFASRRNNNVSLNYIFLQKRLPITKKITKKTLQPLIDAEFIECYQGDSKVIAGKEQDATPETETETETETKQSKAKQSKDKYLDFVLLSKVEYGKLVKKFGEQQTKEKITELNEGIGSKGYKYDSHYFTILSWDRKHKKEKNVGTGKKNRRDSFAEQESSIGQTIES